MCEKLSGYFLSNDLLHCGQHGFRKNCAAELAVNQIVEELIEAGEKKTMTLIKNYLTHFYSVWQNCLIQHHSYVVY